MRDFQEKTWVGSRDWAVVSAGALREGRVCIGARDTGSDRTALDYFTPSQAREIAAHLLKLANLAEVKGVE